MAAGSLRVYRQIGGVFLDDAIQLVQWAAVFVLAAIIYDLVHRK